MASRTQQSAPQAARAGAPLTERVRTAMLLPAGEGQVAALRDLAQEIDAQLRGNAEERSTIETRSDEMLMESVDAYQADQERIKELQTNDLQLEATRKTIAVALEKAAPAAEDEKVRDIARQFKAALAVASKATREYEQRLAPALKALLLEAHVPALDLYQEFVRVTDRMTFDGKRTNQWRETLRLEMFGDTLDIAAPLFVMGTRRKLIDALQLPSTSSVEPIHGTERGRVIETDAERIAREEEYKSRKPTETAFGIYDAEGRKLNDFSGRVQYMYPSKSAYERVMESDNS